MKYVQKIGVIFSLLFCSLLLISFESPGQSQGTTSSQQHGSQQGSRGGQQSKGGASDGLKIDWRSLNLSQKQIQQIQQLRLQFQAETRDLRQQLSALEQDLMRAMQNISVESADLETLLTGISAVRQQISRAAVENLLAMKALLTEQQLEKLAFLPQQLSGELKGIQLTKEQRSQLHEIMNAVRKKNRAISDQLRDVKAELQELLLGAGDVDEERLRAVQATIAEHELALERSHIDAVLQIRKMLTPQQRDQLSQQLQSRKR